MTKGSVAIVGGGIGGLSAARYLRSQGFTPTVFESHSDIGGQWNTANPHSGVWPTMRTNTASFATKLSDVQYPDGVKIFPFNHQVLAMVKDMVERNGLASDIR